jgi:hypothetical protein
MTGILWLPYSTQSGSVAGESASEIFHNTAQALAVSGLIIVALLCIFVNCMLFYAHFGDCGCNTCRGLDMFWSFLGWALNTVASAHFCDSGKFSGSFVAMSRTVIGENGPTDARLFVLFILTVSLFAIALVHGVMFMNTLFSSTRPAAQCPFTAKKTGDSAAGDAADSMVQWENRAVGCGGVWERELAGALERKQK